jgi:hypothetical protein
VAGFSLSPLGHAPRGASSVPKADEAAGLLGMLAGALGVSDRAATALALGTIPLVGPGIGLGYYFLSGSQPVNPVTGQPSTREALSRGEAVTRSQYEDLQEYRKKRASGMSDEDIDAEFWKGVLEVVHTVLDVVGMIPVVGEIADLANAALYGVEGNYVDAGLSLAGAIPGLGWGATGTKLARKGVKAAAKAADKARDAAKVATKVADAAAAAKSLKAAENVTKAAKAVDVAATSTGWVARNLPGLNKAASWLVHGQLSKVSKKLHDGVAGVLNKIGFQVCFAAETPMRTAWGSVRADEVRAGMELLSRDEYNPEGPVEPKVVEEVFVREGLICTLKVMGQTIRSTDEHLFFVRDKGWTPLNQIHEGERIWTEASGWVRVDAVESTDQWETVYNFRIADHHTYFVGDVTWGFGVWAHNTKCPFKKGHWALGQKQWDEYLDWYWKNKGSKIQKYQAMGDVKGKAEYEKYLWNQVNRSKKASPPVVALRKALGAKNAEAVAIPGKGGRKLDAGNVDPNQGKLWGAEVKNSSQGGKNAGKKTFGNTDLKTQAEVANDAKLVQQGYSIAWVFVNCKPTEKLRTALKAANIEIVEITGKFVKKNGFNPTDLANIKTVLKLP